MKLLLTSGGVTNKSIAGAFEELAGKKPGKTKIGFIPTAANPEAGKKDWYVKQLTNLSRFGYEWIDIIDVSAAKVDWRQRLGEMDSLFVSGGNTFHLLDQARKTGFNKWLKENIERIVYVGVSAGSILATKSIGVAGVEPADPNLPGLSDLTALGFVDFEISPHVPELVPYKASEHYANDGHKPLYAIDDQTAIKVVDSKIEVVSEGKWKLFN